MKRTLLFTQIYPPRQGGAATFYSNLVGTNQNEMDFFILSEYDSSEKVVDCCNGDVLYRILPKAGWLPRLIQIPLEVLILFLVSAYIVTTKNIDIIHSHASRGSIVGLSATATGFGIPIIYDCRDTGFRPRVIKMGPTPVWFSCASNIDQILINNRISEDRIVRLPVVNPEYVRKYRNAEIPEKPTELVYIGSIVERKGVFVLLAALETIRERGADMHLTVIGNGPAMSAFKKQCRNRGLNDHVTTTGSLSHDETLRRLAESDILVLPSESEGVPRVVLEGQDVGTPVVATAVGGIPDVINHEENGMLAEQTAESVAKNILRLVRDDKLYRTIVDNGIESANERSWERVGEQLREGYSRASSNKRQTF